MAEIPSPLLEVFADESAKSLLLLLAAEKKPVRYSEARERLKLHPQTFQRALDRLKDFALVQVRTPRETEKPHAERAYVVHLEISILGEFAADLWRQINQDLNELMAKRNLPEDALEVFV